MYSLCQACANKGNYASGLVLEHDFQKDSIKDDHWERLYKEITPEIE